MSTLIAKNQTVGDIILKDLASIVVPGSGQATLSDYFNTSEIQDAADLNASIAADDILLNDGSNDLTKEESLNIMVPVVSRQGNDISVFLTTSIPDSDWDDSDTAVVGKEFFVGALVQKTTNGILYVCQDASTGAAVWNIVVQEKL